MSIAVLAIGSEILDGRVLDTNSQFISKEISVLGLSLSHTVVCDDDEEEIVRALHFLSAKANIIIVTGGLGPTTDDVTREAIATFSKRKLFQDNASLTRLKEKIELRKRVYDSSNDKQSYFPEGSEIILNPVGTADGFSLDVNGVLLFSVPGVPKEMYPMFREYIYPKIKEQSAVTPIERRGCKIFGLPEAVVGSRVKNLSLPPSVVVSYRATFPEIHVVAKSPSKDEVASSFAKIVDAVGKDFVYSLSEEGLPETVSSLLIKNNRTVAVAESCTGGMLGMLLTNLSGSSSAFYGGLIAYSNDVKMDLLDIPEATLLAHGAVSSETASLMATHTREKFKTQISISITGVAGPGGGSEAKPVGTFFVGLSTPARAMAFKHFIQSDRAGVRRYASFVALDTIRREILGLPFWDYATNTLIR